MLKKCNLNIILDQPDKHYRHGDTVTGSVELAPLDGIDNTVLTLGFQWQTDGHGDRTAGAQQILTLHEGAVPPGRLQRYPFSFVIPDGPPTYHGEHLHVTWPLTAHADIPWARDPNATLEVLIEGSAATPLASLFPKMPHGGTLGILLDAEPDTFQDGLAAQEQADHMLQRGTNLLGCGKKIFNFFGGLMVVMGMAMLINDPEDGIAMILFGAAFWGLSYLVFRAFARFEAARTAPEGATATASPSLLRPGETVHLTIQFAQETSITKATASLQGEEYVSYERRNSDNEREIESRTHTFYNKVEPLKASRHANGSTLKTSFQIPHDAPASFNANYNTLRWQIALSAEIEGRSHPWHYDIPLVIRP